MKRTYLFALVALAGGFLLGYLIFSGSGDAPGVLSGHDHAGEPETAMWTCSMHPQIMQPEPGNCPICGMELIPADAASEGLAPGQFRMSENAMALADIRTTRVGGEPGGAYTLRLSGTIAPNEKTIATQSAYFDGRVETLSVNYEGEAVQRGQRLATLYAPDLVAAQQELLTAARLKASQPDLYRAVRRKLDLWKLSDTQIRQIEESGEVQEYFPVLSDVSGTVSEITVAAGDYVRKGAPLFRIADLSSVWVEFDAYENQVSLLKEGQALNIRAGALAGEEFRAPISFIAPVLNEATRTAVVRAQLANPSGSLKPGMFVTAELEVSGETAGDRLVVPESAVLWTGERSVVYIRPDPARAVFELREIELGKAVPGGYQVLEGLSPGAEVVTNGTFTLDAAAQLQGGKSMMNPGGGRTATGHEGHGGASLPGSEEPGTASLSDTEKAVYLEIIDPYLRLKDALVAADPETAREAALSALALLDKGTGIPALLELTRGFRAIGQEQGIAAMREHFIRLSDQMISVGTGVAGFPETLYVQFCPMANDNGGAYWISAQQEIENPYFGDAMLTCGEVRDTWAR